MRHLTIRLKLLLACAAAALGALLLAGLALMGNQRGTEALQVMLEDNIKPFLALQRVDTGLNAVRFRAAGALLDHFPVPGTLNHLRDTGKEIEASWKVVAAAAPRSPEEAELRKQMTEGWAKVPALLAAFDKAYAAGNKPALDDLLQADWAGVHKAFVKPMHALLPMVEAAAEATLVATAQANRRTGMIVMVLAVLMIVTVTAAMLLTARSVNVGLKTASASARAMALGEQSQGIGQVSSAVSELDRMTQQNSALVEQSAAAAESLREQAQRMNDSVAVFRTA